MPYYYRARIRNATDTADALVVTSVPSGTNPFISAPPSGDGQGFNPRTGATEVGAYTVRIADNGGAANVITGFLSDGNGRYDKLGRRAYLEYGTDGTTFPTLLVAGYITALSYPSAAEAQVTVGEAQRAERTKQAFTAASTNFPATTMLGGGPVRWPAGVNPPVNFPDRGKWTVKRVDAPSGAPTTLVRFVSGYVLKDEKAADYTLATDGVFPTYMRQRSNTLAQTEVPQWVPAAQVYQHGNVYADVYSAGVLVGTFGVVPMFSAGGLVDPTTLGLEANAFMLEGGLFGLIWSNADPAGTQYQLYLYSRTISENAPLHVLKHPVDVVTGLIADAGELWDATSAAAVKGSIGADVLVFLRITTSETTDAAIARLMGLFGFGRRINAANTWEFFDQRTKPNTAPATVITLDDLREIPTDVWALEDPTILNNVTVSAQRFALWAPGQSTTRPPDSLVPVDQKRTARFQLADGTYPETSQGVKELTYELPGTILNAQGAEVNLTDFTNALAAHAFDRWGYGAPWSGLVLRTNIGAQIGDEVLLQLNYLPNANVRGGQRIVQLVQRTNEPGGPVVRVEDAGSTAQPAVAPVLSIAASAATPQNSADVSVTNAAALAAAGVQSVLIEWTVSAGTPSAAGQDLGAVSPVAPVTLTTPRVPAGSKVWVRGKSIQPGRRAGVFTSWVGATLTGVGAPSSLTFTTSSTDGSTGTLSWVAGGNSSAYTVRVLLRLAALSAASDVPVAQLLQNSIAAPLSGMTPGVSYVATVQYIDPQTGLVAASATLSLTAGASTLTLQAPVSPVGVVGSTDDFGIGYVDGTYGLDVTAVQLPGVVEFWEAIETGIGTGIYGTAGLVSIAPSVSGGPTSYRKVAANDGLQRSMTARHVATGAIASPFTTAVAVNPWGAIALPSSRLLGELGNVQWSIVAGVTTITFQRNGITDSVWGAAMLAPAALAPDWNLVAASVSPLPAGATSYVVPTPVDGQVTLVQLEPRHADLTAGIVRRLIITATPQPPTYALDDVETPTVGTQFVQFFERGIQVTLIEVQTQIGTSPISAWGAPTRVAGATSVVHGGVLPAGAIEHDVALDSSRQSWIFVRYTLTPGSTPLYLPPFGFDRDKNPNLGPVTVDTTGKLVSIVGDIDTKSVGLYAKSPGTWKYEVDGTFATIDVTKIGTNGVAGLGAATSGTFTAKAWGDPVVGIPTSVITPDARDIFVLNGGVAPSAGWDTASVTAPPSSPSGSTNVTIALKATSAPLGWTVKIYLDEGLSSAVVPTTDRTATLTPAAGAVPTVLTSYTFTSSFPSTGSGGRYVTLRLRADLLDNTGAVADTKTLQANWYS